VYNVKVYIYQKNGFKKREHISLLQSKKVIRASTYEFSSMLKKLETIKMFFTAIETVPFVVDRILHWSELPLPPV
jgi:hypothetical protein